MSRINWVYPAAKVSVEPSRFGTMAIFDVTRPSNAFSVDASGRVSLSGHKVRNPKAPLGTTVALKTYAAAVVGGAHGLLAMGTVRSPMNGWPLLLRLS